MNRTTEASDGVLEPTERRTVTSDGAPVIVSGVNGSRSALSGVRWAAQQASQRGSSLRVLAIVPSGVDVERIGRHYLKTSKASSCSGRQGHRGRIRGRGPRTGGDVRRPSTGAPFEYLIDHVMTHQPVTALCAFNLDELGSPAVAELACLHPLTSPQASRFQLYTDHPNAQTEPDGHDLALTGHLDLPCTDLLNQALTHAHSDKLVINDRGLTYLDHHTLAALNHHARAHRQHLTLRLAPALTTRLTPLPPLTHVHIESTAL